MPVIVTRPASEAASWVRRLEDRGIAAQALPLLAITPVADAAPLQAAWRQLAGCGAVMFVSVNAVTGFFAARGHAPWPATTRAWAPGPGTAAALLAQGLPASQVDAPAPDAAQYDSEALWSRVAGQLHAGGRLLLVRGAGSEGRAEGRDWLAQRLRAEGVQVDEVVAYARGPAPWSAADEALAARASGDGSWWLFSSSQAVRHLRDRLPGTDWSQARAVATHPRIAEAARSLGFCVVRESRPALDDVVASIESAQ